MSCKLDFSNCMEFVDDFAFQTHKQNVLLAQKKLQTKTGAGSEYSLWHTLPLDYDRQEFEKIKRCAKEIQKNADVLVVIGIGGSYIGARAAVEFVHSGFYNNIKKSTPDIHFAGNNISGDYLNHIIETIGQRDFCVNVISKSGTTTEPAIAFRVFKEMLVKKYGIEGARERIYATTDAKKGALRQMAQTEGYETFCIPDGIGGRYSVLTAVGLLPMAVCGVDIDAVMAGAAGAYHSCQGDEAQNDCFTYAALRNCFYDAGRSIEIFAAYEPSFAAFGEWLKQLFAESEGKGHKGIFPAFSQFSTDLHSIGQYIQDGLRNQFETVLWVKQPKSKRSLSSEAQDLDGLNYLANKTLDQVNHSAFLGTLLAHVSGGVPNIVANIDQMDEYHYGYLTYFFEKACALSGYVLGVNPFDQPGVEDYKNNMFALLDKPGYEDRREELLKKLSK